MYYNYNNEYIKKIFHDHDEEIRKLHIMFNNEIKEIKQNNDVKTNNLEMLINEMETKMFVLQSRLNDIKYISNKKFVL